MTVVRYTPASRGTWLMIVRQDRLLVVDRRSGGDQSDALWQAAEPSDGVQVVLDELTRGGISHAPAFALATWSGDLGTPEASLGLIVRGDLSVVAHTDAGPIEVDGRGVSTWNERALSGVTGLEVRTETAREARGADDAELRIESGMAWAAHIRVGATGGVPADEPAATASSAKGPAPVKGLAPEKDPAPEKAPSPRTPDKPTEDSRIPSETTRSDFTIPGVMSEEAPEEVAPPAAGGESGYDYLFGETIARTVEDAAVRAAVATDQEPEPGSAAGSSRVELDGDHDGKTAIGLDRATRQAARRARAQKAGDPGLPAGPGLFIDLSSGVTEELTQPILIGRAPSVSKVSGGNLPRLVTITGTDQDISRNHVQVAVEGGTVVVTDLHSRNGTMIVLPGRPPQQLRAGEPTAVIVGTVVDLGAGVTFTVREG
jgi:hypothetical protein